MHLAIFAVRVGWWLQGKLEELCHRAEERAVAKNCWATPRLCHFWGSKGWNSLSTRIQQNLKGYVSYTFICDCSCLIQNAYCQEGRLSWQYCIIWKHSQISHCPAPSFLTTNRTIWSAEESSSIISRPCPFFTQGTLQGKCSDTVTRWRPKKAAHTKGCRCIWHQQMLLGWQPKFAFNMAIPAEGMAASDSQEDEVTSSSIATHRQYEFLHENPFWRWKTQL